MQKRPKRTTLVCWAPCTCTGDTGGVFGVQFINIIKEAGHVAVMGHGVVVVALGLDHRLEHV